MTIKNTKLIGIGFLVVLSLIFIISPFLFKKSGVTIVSISPDSVCNEVLLPGSIITKIDETIIKTPDDFYSVIDDLEGRINFIINGGPRVCEIGSNEKIDVKIMGPEKKGIKFGVDINGGKEFVLESEDVSGSLVVLKNRFDSYALKNTEIKSISEKSFSITFNSNDEYKVEKLLEPGIASVKFMKNIEIKNNTGKFLLNDNTYDVKINNDTLGFNGGNYKINDEFLLNGINVKIYNITENYTSFFLDVFDGEDVKEVLTADQNSRVFQNQGQYVYVLNIIISEEAGKRFSKITNNQPSVINPQGEDYLQDPLVVFIDDNIVTSMPILNSDSGKEITQLVIWGVENKKEQSDEKLIMLITCLKSGRLPDVEIVERKDVEPENKGLLNLSVYFVDGIAALSCVYSFVRFKKTKIVGIVLSVFIIESLLFLGVVSSHVFAFILVVFCCISSFTNKQSNRWIKWITVGLMFLISFATVVNKLVVNKYILFGVMIGFSVSMIQLTLLNEGIVKAKDEKFSNYIWKSSLVLSVILTIVFFLQDYRNISIASTIITMIGLTLTKPEYTRLVKKLKGS